EENLQSRLRGVILMALSNKFGSLLLTTGNKSELSVGYATLYGDMNGGFNPIKDIYKTELYRLAKWRNKNGAIGALGGGGVRVPENILTKAPSAELAPNQKDEDSLPAYEVLDAVLYEMIERETPLSELEKQGYGAPLLRQIEHLLYRAEYKRRQASPGIRVNLRNFGRGRRYPITHDFREAQQ
ncbi:MAG: NAD(+) synthase, partial [Parvibaculales bacterium]